MNTICTDDRVTMTVYQMTQGRVSEREILGVVHWVDHEYGTAEVYWETGETRVHELTELRKYVGVERSK